MAKDKAPEKGAKKGKSSDEKPSKKADSKPAKKGKSSEDDEFTDPASGSGFTIQGEDHLGKLFLVKPLEVEKDVKTEYGVTDAIRANVVMFDKKGKAEAEEDDILVFPKVLQSQLRPAIGKTMVLGRLGQGTAKAKQDPPWRLEDPDEDDRKIARQYLAKTPF